MSPNQDSEWPRIRASLVSKIEAMNATIEAFKLVAIEKEKAYSSLNQAIQKQMQNHHDALYGFLDDNGEWKDGIIKIVGDHEKRRKNMEKKVGWVIYGFLTAIGIGLVDIVVKFWKFLTSQSGHSG